MSYHNFTIAWCVYMLPTNDALKQYPSFFFLNVNCICFMACCMILRQCMYKILSNTRFLVLTHIGIVNSMCNVMPITIPKGGSLNVYWDFG